MSYLELKAGIEDFNQAVISFWFRIPKAMMVKASNTTSPDQLFQNYSIPLLTFGKPQKYKSVVPIFENVCTFVDGKGPSLYAMTKYADGQPFDVDPCCIGVYCGENDDKEEPTGVLYINIQMAKSGRGENIRLDAKDAAGIMVFDPANTDPWHDLQDSIVDGDGHLNVAEDRYEGPEPRPPGEPSHIAFYILQVSELKDFTKDFLDRQPEVFYVESIVELKPDKWHHVLISFDLDQDIETSAPEPEPPDGALWKNISEGTDSHAKMWLAIDDKDYRGRIKNDDEDFDAEFDPPYKYHLGPYAVVADVRQSYPPYYPGFDGEAGDPNGILTKHAFMVADEGSAYLKHNRFVEPAEFSYDADMIPSKSGEGEDGGAPMGIPASTKYVENIYQVEMAELQMFTGVTMDTGEEENRRAFISEKGRPVSPIKSQELLKQRPIVMLHGSKKWVAGKNTGSSGLEIDDDGNSSEIADGQFKPTPEEDGIEPWRPGPTLHGPQKPKEKPNPS